MNRWTELQTLLWPRAGICTEEALYFRREKGGGQPIFRERGIDCEIGEELRFDTYFNAFSIEKWRKYTDVSRLYLKLRLAGDFQVFLTGFQYRNGAAVSAVLAARRVRADTARDFLLEYPPQDSLLCSFTLQSLSEHSRFFGGAYCVRGGEYPPVRLALNICTYHREAFVLRTLERLAEALAGDSPLRGNLHVYITDNGCTLRPDGLDGTWTHLERQDGFGSAGGFARGQLAIRRDQAKYGLTHMIFMDDDLIFDPEILTRVYWFLRLLKQKFRGRALGGALLRLHAPAVQVEAGALWRQGRIAGVKPDLDLRSLEQVLWNEVEEAVEYQGWWFCCVPLSEGLRLPLPVYFHRDDVEFGLRQSGFLHLNGVGVWHDEFENKPYSQNEYYDFRNQLIVNAARCPAYGKNRAARDLARAVLKKTAIYRYREAELILSAAEDFCRGAEWVVQNDCGARHARLAGAGYRPRDASELPARFDPADYERNLRAAPACAGWKKAARWALGFLLHANREISAPAFAPSMSCFYRVRTAVCYNAADGTAYMVSKSVRETLRVLLRLLRGFCRLRRGFDGAAAQWRAEYRRFTGEGFWKARLHFESGENES